MRNRSRLGILVVRATGIVLAAGLRGAAKDLLKIYRVMVDGKVGRIDVPLDPAVQSE